MVKALRGLYASVARTATPTPVEVTERSFDGARIVIDATAINLTPSVVFNIEGYEPISNKWYLILASAAIVAVGTTVLRIHSGAAETANVSTNQVLPMRWRVRPVHGDTDSITYTVAAEMWAEE
jgi:hypothetical protein